MPTRMIEVVNASDLVTAINRKCDLRWRDWYLAYYLYFNRNEHFIHCYYFGKGIDETVYSDNELKVVAVLREMFPDKNLIYIDLDN